jgi:hypothetical protein
MGYDITFHPVSVEELQHYVFDVVDAPELAGDRASQLTSDPEKLSLVAEVYRTLEQFRDSSLWSGDVHFGSTVAYCAAAIAGFLYPFWYSRGGAVTFLGQHDPSMLEIFTSLTAVARGTVAEMPDESDGILGLNYTGSGFIEPQRVGELLARLKHLAHVPLSRTGTVQRENLTVLDAVFDYDGLASLLGAVHYAIDHGLGLVEASDVVVPLADQTVTDPGRFREHDPDERDDLLRELWPEFDADGREKGHNVDVMSYRQRSACIHMRHRFGDDRCCK